MSEPLLRKEDAARMRPWRPAALADVKPISAAPARPAGTPNAPQGAGSPEAQAAAAKRALEQERQRARVEGFQSGYDAGYQSGAEAARHAARRLTEIAETVHEEWHGMQRTLSGEVMELAIEIARQVLRSDVRLRRDALLDVVREAMNQVADGASRPELHLHPADVETVRSAMGDELTRSNWRIVEAHSIEPGGCRVATSQGEVDATLAMRWRRVMAALGSAAPWVPTGDADEA